MTNKKKRLAGHAWRPTCNGAQKVIDMIIARRTGHVDPVCISGNGLIADAALDSATREHLAEFTTPRRMGGRLYWLSDEVLP